MIGDRIKFLRKQKKITQQKLADLIEVSKQAISYWERGARDPNLKQRKKICAIFNISESELFSDNNVVSLTSVLKKVPVISWVHANSFKETIEDMPSKEFVYTTSKGENLFALKVKHSCMEPEFREGDIVVIQPNIEPSQNDFVIIRDDKSNEATFKQFKIFGNKIILHPLNPKYPDIELNHKKQYTVIGKVVEKVKKY